MPLTASRKTFLSLPLLSAGLLVACAPASETASPSPIEEVVVDAAQQAKTGPMQAESHNDMQALAVEKRVAFMSGHVEAGLALYRAGAPDQAAKHLLHPVSETHQAERAGIDALGFDQQVFLDVSEALNQGLPADEIEPRLAAAEANMALIQANAGGDPIEIISFLLDTIEEEYRIGVNDGMITDAGEYQDAFGFTVVALNLARDIDSELTGQLTSELETLLALWPETGPLAAATPAPVADLDAQTANIRYILGAL